MPIFLLSKYFELREFFLDSELRDFIGMDDINFGDIYIYRYFDVRFDRKVVKMNRVGTILLVKILRDVELELIFFCSFFSFQEEIIIALFVTLDWFR